MDRVLFSIALLLIAGQGMAQTSTASFNVEDETGMFRTLGFALSPDHAYLVYELADDLGSNGRLVLDIRDRDTGQTRTTVDPWSVVLGNFDEVSHPYDVGIVDASVGVMLFLAGRSTYAMRLDAHGLVSELREVGQDLGDLLGVLREDDSFVGVFSRSVVVLDEVLEVRAERMTTQRISAFANDGDTIWVLEVDAAKGVEAALPKSQLMGLSLANSLVELASVEIDLIGPAPKLVGWADEVLLFMGNEETWKRCAYRIGTPQQVDCVDLILDSAPVIERIGTMALWVHRMGSSHYVLALPNTCGLWATRFDRSHVPSPVRPTLDLEGGGLYSAITRVDGSGLYLLGAQMFRRGPLSTGSRVVFGPVQDAPVAAGQAGVVEQCPRWNDAGFFASAAPSEVRACIDAGANPNVVGPCGGPSTSPLAMAIALSPDAEVIDVLLAGGADPSASLGFGSTALHHAVLGATGAETLKKLVAAGAEVNARDDVGMTPLHYLALKGRDAVMLATLLDVGADPRLLDTKGNSPLDYARSNAALRDATSWP